MEMFDICCANLSSMYYDYLIESRNLNYALLFLSLIEHRNICQLIIIFFI